MEQRKPVRANTSAFSSMFLGICLIISAVIIGGKLSNLNKTITAQKFTSTYPSTITVDNKTVDSTYLTQEEAAEYLSLSTNDVIAIITNGQITKYIKNGDGVYVIPKDAIDDWFDTYCTTAAK